MTNSTNAFAETTIVAFHIGRGGHFNNPGHLTFLGENNIGKYVGDLFLRFVNEGNFANRYGFDSTNDGQKSIRDLIDAEEFDELEEKFGITEEMLGDEVYYDQNGNQVGLTEKECESGVGRINEDNEYDTTYACRLSDCDDNELRLIANYHGYVDSSIRDYAKEQLGISDEIEENEQ